MDNQTVQCPGKDGMCGKDLSKQMKFCSDCGFKIVPELFIIETIQCPGKEGSSCGELVKKGQNFCMKCGRMIDNSLFHRSLHDDITCTKCGINLDGEMKFCPNCGERCPSDGNHYENRSRQMKCIKCASTVKQGSKFCNGCGWKLHFCPRCEIEFSEEGQSCSKCYQVKHPIKDNLKRNTIPCKGQHCKNELADDDDFCSNCGYEVDRSLFEPEITCIKCSGMIKAGSNFCRKCRWKVHVCPRCKKDLSEEGKLCPKCDQVERIDFQRSGMQCQGPQCTNQLTEDDAFCSKCGCVVHRSLFEAAGKKCIKCSEFIKAGSSSCRKCRWKVHFCPRCNKEFSEDGKICQKCDQGSLLIDEVKPEENEYLDEKNLTEKTKWKKTMGAVEMSEQSGEDEQRVEKQASDSQEQFGETTIAEETHEKKHIDGRFSHAATRRHDLPERKSYDADKQEERTHLECSVLSPTITSEQKRKILQDVGENITKFEGNSMVKELLVEYLLKTFQPKVSICLEENYCNVFHLDSINTIVGNLKRDINRYEGSKSSKRHIQSFPTKRQLQGFYVNKVRQEIFRKSNSLVIVDGEFIAGVKESVVSHIHCKSRDDFLSFCQIFSQAGIDMLPSGIFLYEGGNLRNIPKGQCLTAKRGDYCEISSLFLETMQWQPRLKDLIIEKLPLEKLEQIDSFRKRGLVQHAFRCSKSFFSEFGSHIYKGNIGYGGIIQRTEYLEEKKNEITSSEKSSLSNFQKMLLMLEPVPRTEMTLEDFQISLQKVSNKNEKIPDKFIIGPSNDHEITVPFWEIALAENASQSEIIKNRSLEDIDYLGIWDLLSTAASHTDFSDTFCEFLKQAWIKIEETVPPYSLVLTNEETIGQCLSYVDNELTWQSSLSLVPIELLHKEISESSSTDKLKKEWMQQLKEYCTLEKLLELANKCSLNKEKKKDIFRWCMRICHETQLMEIEGKDDIKSIIIEQEFSSQLLESRDFATLRDILFGLKELQQKGKSLLTTIGRGYDIYLSENNLDMFIQSQFESLVQQSIHALRVPKRLPHLVTFLECVIGLNCYNFQQQAFARKISTAILETLIRAISDKNLSVSMDDQICSRKQQASLFHNLFDVINTMVNNEEEKRKLQNHIMCIFNVPLGLDPYVRQTIFDSHLKVSQIIQSLKYISDGKAVESNVSNLVSWEYFEKKSLQFFLKCDFFENVKVNAQIPEVMPRKDPLRELLVCLDLQDKYPEKITLQDVQMIQEKFFHVPERLRDLQGCILRKIFAVDYTFREQILEDFIESTWKDEEKKKMLTKAETVLHPMDVTLAIFLCCDMFLQNVLAQKIASCQFALPFMYQLSNKRLKVALWPLRNISVGDDENTVLKSAMKKVSFVRIGELENQSKSKLVNEFLREQNAEHATFFHLDCPLGHTMRRISNGLVEISWFVPSNEEKIELNKSHGQRKDKIVESMAIFNLRGNANDFKKQVEILVQLSDIIVVFIECSSFLQGKYDAVLNIIHGGKFCITILTGKTESAEARSSLENYISHENEMKTNMAFIVLHDFKRGRKKNASETKSCLRKEVKKFLEELKNPSSLEQVTSTLSSSVSIDEENDEDCKRGKELADSLFKMLKPTDESLISRENVLPLQGEAMWQSWSILLKESHRTGKGSHYDTDEVTLKKMVDVRTAQLRNCNTTLSFMERFVETLYITSQRTQTIVFFLAWFKHHLNNHSKKILPQCLRKFKEMFNQYENERSDENKKKLDDSEKKLADSSFGLEHCFRELGQIYEAFMYHRNERRKYVTERTFVLIQALPVIVARLLLMGLPLEILDGDAANVPLTWIRAVFEALERENDEMNLYSISVLGIQSSGKSTLLNSMFGLQFAVSAGRCTRGVYMQLVPVGRESCSLKCSHVMIIDTEGLRAPELASDKFHHDNELATFVIGLGDHALVNIKGETIADLEDVLQIVVHALLRLQRANNTLQLKQTCTFIHQNVSAQDAEKQMMQGHQKTMQKLDSITIEVAKDENIAHVHTFKDVIAFDPTMSIKYVPDLWQGSPPMAATNPKYSAKMLEIVDHLLLRQNDKKPCLKVMNTFRHIHNLWSGILKEDFVFSFRNTLEVKAYSSLDDEYQRLVWSLEEHKLRWFNDNARQKLSRCDDDTKLNNELKILQRNFEKSLESKFEEAKTKLKEFMDTSDLKDHMIQWREKKLFKINTFVDELRDDFKSRLTEVMNQCKIDLSRGNLLVQKQKEINEKAQDLAVEYRGKNPSDTELSKIFDDIFHKWFQEINDQLPKSRSIEQRIQQLEGQMTDTLLDFFMNNKPLVRKAMCKDFNVPSKGLEGSFRVVSSHINTKYYLPDAFQIRTKHKMKTHLQNANTIINDILREVDFYIANVKKLDNEVGTTEFKKALEIIRRNVNAHNIRDEHFFFLKETEIEVSILLLKFTVENFKTHNKIFYKKHSLHTKLYEYKSKVWEIFQSTVHAKGKEYIAATMLCEELKELVRKKILSDMPIEIQGTIRGNFSHSKYHLMKDVLFHLSQEMDFDQYMIYVKTPQVYVSKWIHKRGCSEIFECKGGKTESQFTERTRTKTESIFTELKLATKQATEECKGMTIEDWLTNFRQKIEEQKFILNPNSFSHVKDQAITDMAGFQENIDVFVEEKRKELIEDFRKASADTIICGEKSPFAQAFESLWGCQEICPWCKEPCQLNAKHEKEHRCIQHRPEGITGVFRVKTEKLVVENCNFAVQGTISRVCGGWCNCEQPTSEYHPYREYKKYMPHWDIAPQTNTSGSKYWNWFMATFSKELTQYYKAVKPDIPESWRHITKEEAVKSLDDIYT